MRSTGYGYGYSILNSMTFILSLEAFISELKWCDKSCAVICTENNSSIYTAVAITSPPFVLHGTQARIPGRLIILEGASRGLFTIS